MPRANCYIVAEHVYHLTHRCRNPQFLLRIAADLNGYRRRLHEAIEQTGLLLLAYFNSARQKAIVNDELRRQEKWG